MSSPFPDGRQDEVRTFYTGVLGLLEVPPPGSLAHLRLVWFSAGEGLELHFFPGPTDPEAARHFCLNVDDLEERRERLAASGYQPYDDTAIPNRPRFFCRDPFGNLIELTRIEGDYPT
ncbi:MAG: VOC family protein [Candidatus Dormibacteraeota bacterium]|nr:VOC family protein [Candidatus Dormibacteraeota bacterium]